MVDLARVLDAAASGKLRGEELGKTTRLWKLMRIPLARGAQAPTAIFASGPVRDWITIRDQFHAAGISVPDLFAEDVERGIMLMEDLGDRHLADLPPSEAARGYREALAMVLRMQCCIVPGRNTDMIPFSRTFDEASVTAELDRFVDAALPRLFGIPSHGGHVEPIRIEFARLARDIAALPRLCAHHALTARHLHFTAASRLVMTSFENAFMAPPHYDLVSLFYDGWRSPPAKLREELLRRHAEEGKEFLPAWDESTSQRAFGRIALQRILGEFGRIAEECPEEKLSDLKKVLANLTRHLRDLCGGDPDLSAVYEPLRELVPSFRR